MKEIKSNLTNLPQTPYSKGGDIFMEGKPDMTPAKNQQPTIPEHAERIPVQNQPVSPERQVGARQSWERDNARRRALGEQISVDELRTQQMAWEKGRAIPSGAQDIVDINRLTDVNAIALANQINLLEGNFLDEDMLKDYYKEALKLSSSVDQQELLNSLERARNALIAERNRQMNTQQSQAESQRFGFYLQSKDIAQLLEDPIEWLDGQFNVLYKFAQEGQELNSPLVTRIQNVVGDAVGYLQLYKSEALDKFQTLFTIRFNLMQNRTAIGYRSIDNIKQAAHTLQAHGLLYALSLEDHKVGAMFNRMHEILEDERLKSVSFHVTPHTAYQLQDKLIQEQVGLADKGVGLFAGLPKETKEEREKREGNIRRAVRTAYDVFVSSQRMGVLIARGKHLTGDDAYFSDPASGPLNIYNIEDLLYEKFDLYNMHDQEFVERMKLEIADAHLVEKKINPSTMSEGQRLDLGKRLMRDLFAVPDFFSSGWRIKGVLDSLEERFGREKAENLALFMRLKIAEKDESKIGGEKKTRGEIWQKIKEFRPEEIVRIFRERGEDELTPLFQKESFRKAGINNYDDFKTKYGSIIRAIRERGFQEQIPEQISMINLSNDQINIINQALGDREGENVKEMFNSMRSYIEERHVVDALLTDVRFADIYTRTILLDDAILDRLEIAENGFVPLSKRYAADQGGDSLVRSWNDHENAIKAAQGLVGFIKSENPEERIKAALEFAERAADYNGQEQRAKAVRFTVGTFLDLSKKDYFWDVVGLETGLFRTPLADIQRMYGPQAKAMGRDELRAQLDRVHLVLVSAMDKKFRDMSPEDRKNNPDYLKEKIKVEEVYRGLEDLLEVKGKDKIKLAASRFFLFLLLALFGETYKLGKDAIGGKASS